MPGFDPNEIEHSATGSEVTMTKNVLRRAAPAARKLSNFVAPALVVGVLAVSQAHGRLPFYPSGVIGALERSIEAKLDRITADLVRQVQLSRLPRTPRNLALLRANTNRLRVDFNILVPRKDAQLTRLSFLAPRKPNQVNMYIQAATLREFQLVQALRRALNITPFRPV